MINLSGAFNLPEGAKDRKDLPQSVADWRNGWEYPPLKPDELLTKEDYLRVAWEVLRRTPKYQAHFHSLKMSGAGKTHLFRNGRVHLSAFDSSKFIHSLADFKVEHHYSSPQASPGQTFQEYIKTHDAIIWRVIHGHHWAKSFWGISEVIDPATPASAIENLNAFFAPSIPSMVNPWATGVADEQVLGAVKGRWVGNEIPIEYETVLMPRDVLIRLRADQPLQPQLEAVKGFLKSAQLGLSFNRVGDGANFLSLGLAQYWLRVWDAKLSSGRRIPRKELQSHLYKSANEVKSEFKRHVDMSAAKKKGKQSLEIKTFEYELFKPLGPARFENWLKKADGYIIYHEDFYRKIFAAPVVVEHSSKTV